MFDPPDKRGQLRARRIPICSTVAAKKEARNGPSRRSRRPGSNRGPGPYEGRALPAELRRRDVCIVQRGGSSLPLRTHLARGALSTRDDVDSSSGGDSCGKDYHRTVPSKHWLGPSATALGVHLERGVEVAGSCGGVQMVVIGERAFSPGEAGAVQAKRRNAPYRPKRGTSGLDRRHARLRRKQANGTTLETLPRLGAHPRAARQALRNGPLGWADMSITSVGLWLIGWGLFLVVAGAFG
jgi:hypothetical protein